MEKGEFLLKKFDWIIVKRVRNRNTYAFLFIQKKNVFFSVAKMAASSSNCQSSSILQVALKIVRYH